MKALPCWTLAVSLTLGSFASSALAQDAKLIGAWRFISIDEPGTDGRLVHRTDLKGMLVYTPEGGISVQVMYPPSEAALTNQYVKSGYEASFGSYSVDEKAHTVTHHVQGSLTRGLVGQDLPRAYRFSDGHLILKSTRPEEHWSVTWERFSR